MAHWDMLERQPAADGYDVEALAAPGWSPRTICGREWVWMFAGEAAPPTGGMRIALSPTCRQCLSGLDQQFPQTPASERIPRVAAIVAQTLDDEGTVEVVGAPSDQVAPLRRAIRAAVKERLSWSCKTHLFANGLRILVECPPAYERHAERRLAELAAVLNNLL